jgi:D-alanine-D-alanine ligase
VKRLRVGVIYGGRSGEHEVSLASAAAVIANLDRERYDPLAIRIEKDGRWTLPDRPPTQVVAAEVIGQARAEQARPLPRSTREREIYMVARPGEDTLMSIDRRPVSGPVEGEDRALVRGLALDVVFPVLHGPYGEDGTVQGLLELAGVPYVGAGVLASSVGMDKVVARTLFAARGLRVADGVSFTKREWVERRDALAASVAARLGFPVFVKPANLGSSVGISKVKTAEALGAAIDDAAEYDRKILVEAAVPYAREIEVAVLGNDAPEASIPGEIVPSREFYDYEAKYLDEGSVSRIPAPIDGPLAAEIRRQAVEAYRALDCAGMARVDFLLNGETGDVFLNEVNTIPGFTTISMYAKLWAASGIAYPALLDRLVALAIERFQEKQSLRTSVE